MKQCHTVIVIEDDGDLRQLVASLLSRAGYVVEATGDPRDGVEAVRRGTPDLVLCDISMPEMDGYAVVQALRSDPGTCGVPIAFLTARREFTDRVRAFRSGVVDYITKPVTADALLRRVDGIVHGASLRLEVPGGGPAALRDPARALLPLAEPGRLHEDMVLSEPPVDAFGELPAALRQIVIADDDPVFRSTLSAVFTGCGFTVREAVDGLETVSQVLDEPPILLLVDVQMPRLDGLEVCRTLRRRALTRRLPIVFLSGFDDVRERAAGLEAGGDEFLSKRTSMRELLLRVQLPLQRYTRPAGAEADLVQGRIDSLGAPGILQFCLLTGLTGTLTAAFGGRAVLMGFESGRLLSADSGASHGPDAVFEFLTWEQGTFAFEKGAPAAGTAVREPLAALVREGCRRVDDGPNGTGAWMTEAGPAGA